MGRIVVISQLAALPRSLLMQTIQASKFKARCLALMDEVARTGESILVTKNGKPVAELVAHRRAPAKSLIGLHQGRIRITGDIVAPAGAGLWKAFK